MTFATGIDVGANNAFQVVRREGQRFFCRNWHDDVDLRPWLETLPLTDLEPPGNLQRLAHEFSLKDDLDSKWAARPLAFIREHGRSVLLLEDPSGEPLDSLLGDPMDAGTFLRLAVALASALGHLHERGLIHKDIKPANVLVDSAGGQAWLTGFGISSRLPRERPLADPPEIITGTLAYMAPEQTGRMNRSIDARTDLYALGMTFYEMLTGGLPFAADSPIEWIHCHIARKPEPPAARLNSVPPVISAIVMKLLAKTAEDRYQTAAGVAADLKRCLTDWEIQGRLDEFTLGIRDMPGRLLIPEKLYGREGEIGTLLASFDRVVTSGKAELVLVSGYSGIGKSSVVNELHKELVPPRGLFASGKFDQYKRDIPYATLAQASAKLIHMLLSKGEDELRIWRDALREALGPNAQLIVNLVPELALVIGAQPAVPDLPPQDAQGRFQLVFRRFIGVFARREHPLALFLDDLQWLDSATLDLLEVLLTHPDVQYLIIIGAYRDNEVNTSHPLVQKLNAVRAAGSVVSEITLAPLARKDVAQLLADSLHYQSENVSQLAQLVHEKTGGNPFFVLQFTYALTEEGLLSFDHNRAQWCWDLDRIHGMGFTDNVVDLMIGKLNRLPAATQQALKVLACMGNSADIGALSFLIGTTENQVQSDLWEAIRLELIARLQTSCRFVHDRVQEAAYSLIPCEARAKAHLRIGRLLMEHIPIAKREEAIFEIVSQLNRGISLIDSRAEAEQLAELNLIAGRRAKAATAYTSALNYLSTAASLLLDDCWVHQRDLIFSVEINRAECEFLTGDLQASERRLSSLALRTHRAVERAAVASLRVDLYTTLNQGERAVAVALEYLDHLGIQWPAHPDESEGRKEYERILSQLGDREVEMLAELPLMDDPDSLATLDVLTKVFPAALFTDAKLLSLAACKAVNLSIENGNSDASCVAYVWLGMIAGPHFGDYRSGFRFGRLGYELVGRHGFTRFQARTYLWFGQFVVPWTKHISDCRDLFRRAFDAANNVGDLTIAAYSCNNLNTNLLAAGDPLTQTQREAENGLAFARKARFGFVIDIISPQLGLIRTLRGLTPTFGSFDDHQFDEAQFEQHLASEPALALPECWYWTRKLQARFLAGDYPAAIKAAVNAEKRLWTSPSIFEAAEYHFYSALTVAASCLHASPTQLAQCIETLSMHRRQLEIWAENCPDNFETRAMLVNAEIARIEGQTSDAMRFYEKAIDTAREQGFVHQEALANELAAHFYGKMGYDKIARAYLRDAHHGYHRWEAHGKVRQLEHLHPYLREEERTPSPTATIATPVDQLDLSTVIKVSQAVSSEIVRDKLIDILMRTALEHAGAERGVLILLGSIEQRIEAQTTSSGDANGVRVQALVSDTGTIPESVIQYTIRTRDSVIIADTSAQNPFAADPYLRRHQARSLLCIPLTNQAKLIGVLYLENNLCPDVFTPTQIAILKLLASQAAISLENTSLYRDLEEREAKIRRLVDSNIIGIFIWDFNGHIVEANDAFLRMVDYDREDLISGQIRWMDLIPPEWQEENDKALDDLRSTGVYHTHEREYFRRDGSRVPILIGAATFGERGDHGVAFVVDQSERKRAEREMLEIQMNLVHSNRIETLGQLSASIVHEISQPISAAVTNARAALRWMDVQPPDLGEVRAALNRIVNNGDRAADVIGRIHALVKKAPPRQDRIDIREAIMDVIALTDGEASKYGVLVETELRDNLPLVQGDRVQLQQVILNLIVNAFEAMSQMGSDRRELLIRTAMNDSHGVTVEVKDSGPGLPLENLERVFDAFYTTKSSGLGVGLSICRSIIEAHGGRLWATPSESRGIVFQFVLPACLDH